MVLFEDESTLISINNKDDAIIRVVYDGEEGEEEEEEEEGREEDNN